MLHFMCLRTTKLSRPLPGVITTCLLLATCARLCRAEGNKTHSSEECGNSKIMPLKIFAAGVLNKRFVALVRTPAKGIPKGFCYFELPLNALQAKALYLSGGTLITNDSAPKKWKNMKQLISNIGLEPGIFDYRAVTIADAQNRWIYWEGSTEHNVISYHAFNLDTGAIDDEAPHYPFNWSICISSPKQLEMYSIDWGGGGGGFGRGGAFGGGGGAEDGDEVTDIQFRVYQLKGSKILPEATDVRKNASFLICKSDSNHLNTKHYTKDAKCSKNITQDWSDLGFDGSGGWSDGKRFYLVGGNHTYIFEASAFSSKLGQTVPYQKVKLSKFVIFARPPGGKGPSGPDGPDGPGDGSGKSGGHTALVLIILLVLLLIAAVAGYFLWYKPKQEKEKAAKGEGAKGKSISGKGKRSGSKSLAGKRGNSFALSKRNSISRRGSSKSKKSKQSKKRAGASAAKLSTKASSSRKVSIAAKKLSRSRKASSSRKLPGAFSFAKQSRSKKASVSRKISASKAARTVRSKAGSSRKISKSRKLG